MEELIPSGLTGSLSSLLVLLSNSPREKILDQRQRMHFFCNIENWLSAVPTRLNTKVDSSTIWLPGTTGQVLQSSSAYIHIVPSLHSSMSLNAAWRACGYAYQITPHSTPNMLHTSSIIRHVFQHTPTTCTHINIHSATADNWEDQTP